MDEGNGLQYIRARYYDPEAGRFISKDPRAGSDGDGQSLNRYVYALNNPVILVDINGENVVTLLLKFGEKVAEKLFKSAVETTIITTTQSVIDPYYDHQKNLKETTKDFVIDVTISAVSKWLGAAWMLVKPVQISDISCEVDPIACGLGAAEANSGMISDTGALFPQIGPSSVTGNSSTIQVKGVTYNAPYIPEIAETQAYMQKIYKK